MIGRLSAKSMQRLEEQFESKFERLVKEIQEIKFANASEACNDASQQEYKTSLRNENITLKKENTGLAEQVNNYKLIVIVTDMKAKIKDLENEKKQPNNHYKNLTRKLKTWRNQRVECCGRTKENCNKITK